MTEFVRKMTNPPIFSNSNSLRRAMLLVFCLLSGIIWGRNFDFADQLFGQQDFKAASTEYKRLLFGGTLSHQDSVYAIKMIMNTGLQLSDVQELHRSSLIYAHILQQNDLGLRYNSLNLIRNGYYIPALSSLGSSSNPKSRLLQSLVLEYLGHNKQSQKQLLELQATNPELEQLTQKALETQSLIHKHNFPNPYLAGAASIIPGAGYALSGRYETALASLVLNSVLIMASVELYQKDLKWSAGIVFSVFSGFYLGNVYGSATAAARDRFERRKQLLDEFIGSHITEFLD